MSLIADELRRVATGDRAAFTRLYRTTRPALVRHAAGILAGDAAAAEDAVDDAFVAIWSQAGQFDGLGSADGWMRRIVRNKAIDWLRKQREVPMSGEPAMTDFARTAADTTTPFEDALHTAAASAVRDALAMLSVEQHEAVRLAYFEDKSVIEIAALARCPANTVKTRLFHARQIMARSATINELRFA